MRNRRILSAGIAGCVLAGVIAATQIAPGGAARDGVTHDGAASDGDASKTEIHTSISGTGAHVCGRPSLHSPYDYHGRPGAYRSGTRGLPTFGRPGTAFPRDTRGVVLGTGVNVLFSYQLKPDTVYYLLPGTHTGSIQAEAGDAFVGGDWKGRRSVLSGGYRYGGQAIDSNSSQGDQPGVVIEYLTIEKYAPDVDAAAINQEANTGWTISRDTITLNVPGAGVILGAGNTLTGSCLTENGQYGFQSTDTDGFGRDSLTGGPYGVTVSGNEISYNDTCDLSGRMNNAMIGWKNHDPVPARYRNPRCGKVTGDGNQGGFKLWRTNGVTISRNNIHGNWGPGAWVDTDNANTTFADNAITGNEGIGIIEEISYNFSITGNYLADNDWTDGLNNPGFPQAAVYISESGSDTAFGGVPACSERACAGQPSYRDQSVISGNRLVDNGGSVFLWQSSNRYCSDSSDGVCTLVAGGPKGPFTMAGCKANLPSAAVSTASYTGIATGSPARDWWDGCLWRTSNVLVTRNVIDFDPARIPGCNSSAWPDCGAGGIFSQYGSPPGNDGDSPDGADGPGGPHGRDGADGPDGRDRPGWVIPTQLTYFQHDVWSRNTYNGPSTFFAWNQGNGDNPVSWNEWTGPVRDGDKCSSAGERRSGYCTGAFGQDSGSTYTFAPAS